MRRLTENPLMFRPLLVIETIEDVSIWLGIGFPKMRSGEVDPKQVTRHSERQTLQRMMENEDTMVFSSKTYQYPLGQIRDRDACLGRDIAPMPNAF